VFVTARAVVSLAVVTALSSWLVTVHAADDQRKARIGILGPAEEPRFSHVVTGLRQGLVEHGHAAETIELIEGRVRRGDTDSARTAATAFARQGARVIFVIGSVLVGPAREMAPQLPIVFLTPGDPVSSGVVGSLARPGRNVTGMTFEYPELSGKRLEILKELAPRTRRVLVLVDPRDASPMQGVAAARRAAAGLGLVLVEREARSHEEMVRGLETLREVDAVLGIPGGFPSSHSAEIIRRAHAHRLPTIFPARTPETEDAVVTYGASDVATARQAARLVDKILKGANAGDLPVERPATLEFTLSVKSARALGLTIPPTLLHRVDRVIE
jgi:putative tryptophan/tyrosine transport system substrate-binding protein